MPSLSHALRSLAPLRTLVLRLRHLRWILAGRSGPPPSVVKQVIVRAYGRAHGLRVLVETGTYMGDMVHAVRRDFDAIYSIELSPLHHAYARKRLAGSPNVHLLLGDSGEVLGKVLDGVSRPCLFWLDSHYSGGATARANVETPIVRELEAIAKHAVKSHVILIDDARDFDGRDDYPDLEALRALAARLFPGSAMDVETDIIRIVCQPAQPRAPLPST